MSLPCRELTRGLPGPARCVSPLGSAPGTPQLEQMANLESKLLRMLTWMKEAEAKAARVRVRRRPTRLGLGGAVTAQVMCASPAAAMRWCFSAPHAPPPSGLMIGVSSFPAPPADEGAGAAGSAAVHGRGVRRAAGVHGGYRRRGHPQELSSFIHPAQVAHPPPMRHPLLPRPHLTPNRDCAPISCRPPPSPPPAARGARPPLACPCPRCPGCPRRARSPPRSRRRRSTSGCVDADATGADIRG